MPARLRHRVLGARTRDRIAQERDEPDLGQRAGDALGHRAGRGVVPALHVVGRHRAAHQALISRDIDASHVLLEARLVELGVREEGRLLGVGQPQPRVVAEQFPERRRPGLLGADHEKLDAALIVGHRPMLSERDRE